MTLNMRHLGLEIYGAIRHLGYILEVGGHGRVAHLCASASPPPPLPGCHYSLLAF